MPVSGRLAVASCSAWSRPAEHATRRPARPAAGSTRERRRSRTGRHWTQAPRRQWARQTTWRWRAGPRSAAARPRRPLCRARRGRSVPLRRTRWCSRRRLTPWRRRRPTSWPQCWTAARCRPSWRLPPPPGPRLPSFACSAAPVSQLGAVRAGCGPLRTRRGCRLPLIAPLLLAGEQAQRLQACCLNLPAAPLLLQLSLPCGAPSTASHTAMPTVSGFPAHG